MRRFAVAALAACLASAAVAVGAQEVESKDALKTKLIESALKDGPSDEAVKLFSRYALVCLKERVGGAADAEFWEWLDRNPELRDGLLLGLHPKYDPKAVDCLQRLHKTFGKSVDERAHLAVAFALVWGGYGSDDDLIRPVKGFYAKRKPPTMEESFKWYLDNERSLRISPKLMSWPLLVYVADNDLPLDERQWALGMYEKWAAARYEKLYSEVFYSIHRFSKNWKMGDKPRTLENLQKYGGAYLEEAYYSSRVLKTLGLPAYIAHAKLGRDDTTISGFVCPGRTKCVAEYSGRVSRSGQEFYAALADCPLEPKGVPERDIELVWAGAGRSYDGWKRAAIGCRVFEMLRDEERIGARTLLTKCVECDPCCKDAWTALAKLCGSAVIPAPESDKVLADALAKLDEFPDAACALLEPFVVDRRQAMPGVKAAKLLEDRTLLQDAAKRFDRAKRPDLVARALYICGRYQEAVGDKDAATKHYLKLVEAYAKKPYGFIEPFDRVLELMPGDANRLKRLEFLHKAQGVVPPYEIPTHEKGGKVGVAYEHVVTALIAEYKAAGKDKEVERWENDLKNKSLPVQ